MAGVPNIMQVMFDSAVKGLETGEKIIAETIEAGGIPEGRYGTALGEVGGGASGGGDRLLSGFRSTDGFATRSWCAARTLKRSPPRARRSRRCSPT